MSLNVSATSHDASIGMPLEQEHYRMIHLCALLLGLLAAYFPVYRELAANLWRQEAYAHGPIILLAVLALIAARSRELSRLPPPGRPLGGTVVLLAGIAMLCLGIAWSLPAWMAASHIPVLAGIVLMLWGRPGLRELWFPILFLVFLIPLPAIFIELLTWQMKDWIALAAVGLLERLDYPVARSGMIILVGQYQMLIANACSGLHSMLSLSALGVLYTYLTARHDRTRSMLLLSGVLPIALAANVLRTLVLLLVTYHAGDAAGRYWHELMGTIMFVVALAMLLAFDRTLIMLLSGRRS